MIKKILTLSVVSILLWSCNNTAHTSNDADSADVADTTEEYVPIDATGDTTDMHNAQNSLDIAGTYKGVLPCADCEGIETEIELKDSAYVKKIKYLGKGDGQVNEDKGSFKWLDGSTIELEGLVDAPNKYFVGENTLTQLDMEGNKVTGDLADKYILNK
jgi:uncharacterized lipoprotein NlpE involved in copper resistance